MLQEQVSEYLGVTSFKRKYPGKEEKLLINTAANLLRKHHLTVALQECIIIIMYENTG